MALCFPLDDRSAVNLIASVNTSHETKPEPVTEEDNRFYTIFWSVQKWLQNPRENIVDGTDIERREFGQFLFSLEQILKCFTEKQLINNAPSDSTEDELKDDFFVCKYLTNKNLFELQLGDEIFRRQILVQILMAVYSVILVNDFAADRTKKVKATVSADGMNKLKFVQDKCMDMLKRGNPSFAKHLSQLLDREANFAQWKWLNKCEKIVRRVDNKKHNFQRSTKSEKVTMTLNNLSKMKDKMRVMRDNDPEEIEKVLLGGNELLVKEDYNLYVKDTIINEVNNEAAKKRSNHRIFKWKAMRLLARSNMMVLGKISDDLKKDEEIHEDASKFDNKLQQVVYELYFPAEISAPSTPTPPTTIRSSTPTPVTTPQPRVNTPPPPPPVHHEPEDTEMKEATLEIQEAKPEPPPIPPAPPVKREVNASERRSTNEEKKPSPPPSEEERRTSRSSKDEKLDLTVDTGRKRKHSEVDNRTTEQSPSSAPGSGNSHKKRKWNNNDRSSQDHSPSPRSNRDDKEFSTPSKHYSSNYHSNDSSNGLTSRSGGSAGKKNYSNNNNNRRHSSDSNNHNHNRR